jgi:hypothetical protein
MAALAQIRSSPRRAAPAPAAHVATVEGCRRALNADGEATLVLDHGLSLAHATPLALHLLALCGATHGDELAVIPAGVRAAIADVGVGDASWRGVQAGGRSLDLRAHAVCDDDGVHLGWVVEIVRFAHTAETAGRDEAREGRAVRTMLGRALGQLATAGEDGITQVLGLLGARFRRTALGTAGS